MKYKVKRFTSFLPMLNIHWTVGEIIDDIDIDKIFSQNIKECFILDGVIGPIEETPKPMTAEQFIETYHPERWKVWVKAVSVDECSQEQVLEKTDVIELLKRFAKIVRKQERETFWR